MTISVDQIMRLAPVIPVLVIEDPAHAVPLGRALVAGGLPVLEVTLRTPAAMACIEAMLADLGHTVLRAASAPEALSLLRRGDPVDLMLTDVIMPGGKTGVDLAHEAIALRPSLPVILSSGYTGDTLGPASEAPWPLLRKPYDSDALARTVESLLPAEPAST